MKKKLLIVLLSIAAVILAFTAYGQLKGAKQHIAGDSTGLYYKDNLGVYLLIPRDCGFLGCSGRDLRPEFMKYRRISKANPKTFRILIDSRASSANILARDDAHVFYSGEYVPTGDVGSLRVFGSYAKDKNNLYYGGMVINGIDLATVEIIGGSFLQDRNGLYVLSGNPPRKADLIDLPTFQLKPPTSAPKGRDYFGEDKNFYYYSDGGTDMVDSKSNTQNFKNLGCGYFSFQGQIYYSLYQLPGADAASFRVLGTQMFPDRNVDSCDQFYAIDQSHRYEFGDQVRPDDKYRNRQIDLLLATPEDRKRMSAKASSTCVPNEMPGVNFGFAQGRPESAGPGTIRLTHYGEARIVEAELLSTDGQWQQLPSITGGFDGCNSIRVEGFYDGNNTKPWFARRDAASISLRFNQFGQDPVFIICDSRYSIKLAFSARVLIRELKNSLHDARVEPYGSDEGWGTGWILEDKFFLSNDGQPEVWIPLRVKNAPVVYREGSDFVTVGFRYLDDQFECVNEPQCTAWSVPQRFKVDLK